MKTKLLHMCKVLCYHVFTVNSQCNINFLTLLSGLWTMTVVAPPVVIASYKKLVFHFHIFLVVRLDDGGHRRE